jgi:sugar-specific transcriptional regulator TrmB
MTLRDLGFSELQEAVYRALLIDPGRDVTALATLVKADEQELRAALAELVELRAVRPDADAPAGVTAGDPRTAIGELIERLEDEALRKHRRIGDTRAELSELSELRGRHRAGGANGIEPVERLEDVRERLAELAFFTRDSVYSIQPAGSHSAESLANATRLDQRSLRRGVDMRIIYDAAAMGDERNRARLRERVAAGAGIRLREGPLQRLIIMDERVAVVPLDPADSQRGAVIVHQPGLVQGLLELFRRSWESAEDIKSAEDVEPDLVDDDRTVLGLLASGVTDEMAARQIGVSVRHLRRRIARLMDQLAAGSRFQAGVAATRRGWI